MADTGDLIYLGKTTEWDESSAAIFLHLEDPAAQGLRIQEDDSPTAYSLEVENSSGTTVFGVRGSSTTTDMIDIGSLVTTANVLDVSAVSLTTGKVIDMSDLTAITTGKAIHIDATGVTQTDGILVHIDSASTNLTSTGRLLLVDHTGNAGVSTVIAEVKSAAADETVIFKVTASAALAAGVAASISVASMTTGTALSIADLDALTTGKGINLVSNSADSSARSLVYVKNDNASATATTCLDLVNDAPLGAIKTTVAATSTNFFKVGVFNGVTLWVGNGNTGNAALSATAGDILFNGGSNKPEYCTGTNNWTALC